MRNVLLLALVITLAVGFAAFSDVDDDALQSGGARLEALQNNDGGWDWPLDDGNPGNTSPLNTIGPIAMGLARGYWNNEDPTFQAALADTGALLLTKTNNFSPSDGYLATMLDSVFGGSTYRDHVQANFYGPLAAGTFNYKGRGTLYSTADYIEMIRTARSGIYHNLGTWDIGMGLVGAATCGANTDDWAAGVKTKLNEHQSNNYYDVLGLAGGLYGLALIDEEFDPTSGDLAAANNLSDLGDILANYQIANGGFAWNSGYVIPNDANEAVQETSYAILALNQLGRGGYLNTIQGAADWLVGFQLGTGGWGNYAGSGENNEITGEALWGIHAVYVEDVWVDENGDDHAFGYGYIPFETLEEAVSMIGGTNGTIHIGDGTFTLGPGTYITRLFIEGNASVSGNGTTLESPGTTSVSVPESSSTFDPIIFGYGGTMDSSGNVSGTGVVDANISGFEINGLNNATSSKRFVGILLRNVDGEVSDNSLHSLYDADGKGNGPQTFGILVYGDSAVDILNNTVTDYSRGGIVVNGDLGSAPDPVATVQGNTVTGNGFESETGWWADNGIQFGYGATGQIIGNTVTGHWSNSAWGASGIIIASTGNVNIVQNIVQDNELGIALAGYSVYGGNYTATENTLIQENDILDNEYGISLQMDANNTQMLLNIITGNDVGISVADYYGVEAVGTQIHYNSIAGNLLGLENWEVDSDIDASLNWWGAVDGPTVDLDGDGASDYAGGGDGIFGNVIFSPWLGINPDADPGTVGVQLVSPMLFIVDDIGPAPALGYLGTAIDAANTLPGIDSIEVRHGTYDASEPITDGVNIYSEVGSASATFLNGDISINASNVLLGKMRQGFTINGDITVGRGIDASTIHINWNDLLGIVENSGTGTLDALFNYWGEDGPDTIGDVAVYPLLPIPSDIIISYMDDHGLSALDAIDFALLLDLYLSERNALAAVELMNAFGFTPEEAAALLKEYGALAVDRALAFCGGDYEDFLARLIGYASGGGGGGSFLGGGAGGTSGIPGYCVGCTVPLQLELVHPITGEPITDAVVSYSVCRTLDDGTAEIIALGVMTYDGDFGAYVFDVDTTGYEPGTYDIYLGTDDGRSRHFQINVIEIGV